MSDPRQRLLDAIELVNALVTRFGTVDSADIDPALVRAREEMREAARAYVAETKEGQT